jgi:hypothetical protein
MSTMAKQPLNPSISPQYLALGDLALDAAIQLEKLNSGRKADLEVLDLFAKKLSGGGPASDLTLLPIYNRALVNAERIQLSTKSDLYARLNEMSKKLSSTSVPSNDIERLRDFCLAVHDALLSMRIDSLVTTRANKERLA